MKNFTLFLSLLLMVFTVTGQDCENFFPAKKGAFMEMKNYDAKGKITGTVRQTVTDVSNTTGGLVIKVLSEQLDNKDKSLGTQELEMKCKDNVFTMDMKNFFNQAAMGDMQDVQMSVDAKDLVFPVNLKVGESLPDGSLNISMVTGPIPMNMSVNIYNRKIVAMESVTTPAGNFDCYKMTYDIDTKTIMKMTNSAIQWYAKDAGAVRTETYGKNGKLMGYSELTSLRQ